jgi:hypothetical protein
MSYRGFTRLLYSLMGGGFLLLLGLLLTSVLSVQALKAEKRFLAGLFCAIFACLFITNATCGIKHKKMLARGSPATFESDGRSLYWFHIPMNFLLGAMLAYTAIQTWRGIMKVDF